MGNTQQQNRQNRLIDCNLAAQQAPSQIMNVFLVRKEDKLWYVTVSPYTIEQYDEQGVQNKDQFKTDIKILCATQKKIQTRGKYLDTIIVANEKNQLIIINKSNLLTLKVISCYFYQKDLTINLDPKISITCPIEMKNPKIDYIFAQEFDLEALKKYEQKVTNNIYIGLENGFILKMMLTFSTMNHRESGLELEGQVMTVYNPLQFMDLEGNDIIYENLFLTGLINVSKCDRQDYIVGVHRKSDISFQKQPFELEKSPIYIYNEQTGLKVHSVDQIKNTILNMKVLQNQGQLLILCGNNSMCIYSYLTNQIIQNLDFNPFISSKQVKNAFKNFDILEYHDIYKNQLVESVYKQFEGKNPNYKKIDGDLIFLSTQDGDIMISKLFYLTEEQKQNGNTKQLFQPEKIFSIDKKGSIQKFVYQISYHHDCLYMGLVDAKFMIYFDILHHYYNKALTESEQKTDNSQQNNNDNSKKEGDKNYDNSSKSNNNENCFPDDDENNKNQKDNDTMK